MSDAEDRLAAVDLFAQMSKKTLKHLANSTSEVRHSAGSVVTAEGGNGIALHVIVSGTAEVSKGDRVVRTLGPGEYFGEISLIDGKPRSATITAVEDLHTLALPHAGVRDLIAREPDFAQTLLLVLCTRLRQAEAAAETAQSA